MMPFFAFVCSTDGHHARAKLPDGKCCTIRDEVVDFAIQQRQTDICCHNGSVVLSDFCRLWGWGCSRLCDQKGNKRLMATEEGWGFGFAGPHLGCTLGQTGVRFVSFTFVMCVQCAHRAFWNECMLTVTY